MIEKYRILSEIIISFHGDWGGDDVLISPRDNVIIETDGKSLCIRDKQGKLQHSRTSVELIPIWESQQKIMKI